MSDVMTSEITVERVTDTGVLVNGTWWNFSKFGKKPALADGGTYEVEYKAFKGKNYIQKARPMVGTATPPNAGSTSSNGSAQTYTPGIGGNAKDKRILVQGIVQACLQSPGLTGFAANADEYLAAVEAAADRTIKFVLSRAGE